MRHARWLGAVSVLTLGCAGPEATLSDGDLVGWWAGSFEVLGTPYSTVFQVVERHHGLAATITAYESGIVDLDAAAVERSGRTIELRFPTVGASYEGRLARDGRTLRGDWLQAAARFRLVLERTDSATALSRPQNPVPPLPYDVETVVIPNRAAGHQLAGTLTTPRGEGPHVAVVLVSGSGPQDRDEALFGHRPFLVLADHLTRRGNAVLRYDDRGVGESTGDFRSATTEDLATDALAAVGYLRQRPDIDPGAIGIVGHSEGGIVGPIAAAGSSDIAFLVLLAPSGMVGQDLVLLQTERMLLASHVPRPLVELNKRIQREMLEALGSAPDAGEASERVRDELARAFDGLPYAALTALGMSAPINQAIEEQINQAFSPWVRFFLVFDPAPVLERVDVPVLALFGSKDLQVPAQPNLALVRDALVRGGNEDVTATELDGLNHLFQPADLGLPTEYGRIETTFSPEALQMVSEWIRERVGATP